MTDLPSLFKDRDGHGVQGALIPDESSVSSLTLGSSSVSVVLPEGATIVEVSASVACRVAFGDDTVVATAASRVFPAVARAYRVPPGATHFAAIEIGSTAGFVSVTRLY